MSETNSKFNIILLGIIILLLSVILVVVLIFIVFASQRQATSPGLVKHKAVSVQDINESSNQDLEVEFDSTLRNFGNPRLWLRQGEKMPYPTLPDMAGYMLPGFGNSRLRNVGFMDQSNLKVEWYFSTNEQIITSLKDIYILNDQDDSKWAERTTWAGAVYGVVNEDSNGDGLLSSSDKIDVYCAAGNSFRLIIKGVDELVDVTSDIKNSILFFKKGKDLYSTKLDLDVNTISDIQKISAP